MLQKKSPDLDCEVRGSVCDFIGAARALRPTQKTQHDLTVLRATTAATARIIELCESLLEQDSVPHATIDESLLHPLREVNRQGKQNESRLIQSGWNRTH